MRLRATATPLSIALVIILLCYTATHNALGQTQATPQVNQSKPDNSVQHRGDHGAFMAFINEVGFENAGDQLALASGAKPAHPAAEWPDLISHVCPLRREDLSIVYNIAIDTYAEVKANDKEWRGLVNESLRSPSPDLRQKVDLAGKRRPALYLQGIDRMRQALGDNNFAALTVCIDQTYGAADVIDGPNYAHSAAGRHAPQQ